MQDLRIAVFAALCLASSAAAAFDFDDVAARAKKLASKPYQDPKVALPAALDQISYDAFRDIRFRPNRSIWRGSKLPFELQLFHLGFNYKLPVRINLITAQGVQRLRFNPDDFHYGKSGIEPDKMRDLDFAGFRIHYPLNDPEYKDEVAAFVGASYFRALGEKQGYGLSARGLAVDTGVMSGEEFPRFTKFFGSSGRARTRTKSSSTACSTPSASPARTAFCFGRDSTRR